MVCCSRCEQTKPLEEFGWDRRRDQPRTECKTCACERERERRAAKLAADLPDDWPLCECGCGEPTGRAAANKYGYKLGEPLRFIHGHHPPRQPSPDDYTVDEATGCWIWRRTMRGNGYGYVRHRKTGVQAHRHYYEHFVGPLPAEMCLHHRCGNRACVNPEHVEQMSRADHSRLHALERDRERPGWRSGVAA